MSPLAAMDRAMAHTFALLASARRAALLLLISLAAATVAVAALQLSGSSSGTSASRVGVRAQAAIPAQAQAAVSAALGAARSAYHVQVTGGALRASNPAQGLSASFTRAGARISSDDVNLNLSLSSVGFGAAATEQHEVGQASPVGHLNRVAYARAWSGAAAPGKAAPGNGKAAPGNGDAAPGNGDAAPGNGKAAPGNGDAAPGKAAPGDGEAAPRAARSAERGASVSEWYANGPAGIEQGFTVARPPAATATAAAEPLTLALALKTNATPKLAHDGAGLTLTRGSSQLRYGDLLSTDANGHALRTWLQLQPGRLLIRVDAKGAAYPLRIDPMTQAGGKLTANDELGEALLGTSVALSADGGTLLVGGPQDANPARGAAWVFVRSGAEWVQQGAKLTGVEVPEPQPAEEECAEESQEEAGECSFGNSVALSADGNSALVGEPSATTRHGNAWIFTRSGETWTRAAVLVGGTGAGGRFGKSVALSADGHTALVGDPSASGQRGSAWVFTGGGESWSEQAMLTQPGAAHFDHLGRAVALSADGSTALLGAPGAGSYKGGAWAFSRTGSAWSLLGAELLGAGEEGEGRFGKSLALSADGQTALVGASYDAGSRGAVWPFARTGSSFAAQGEKVQGPEKEFSRFGYSVALASDGSAALVGAPRAPEGGTVFTLTRSPVWKRLEKQQLQGSGAAGKGWTGAAVALSSDGKVAAVGAPHDNARVGAAWVFSGTLPPPVPAVTKVSPGFGPAGTVVRIKGTALAGATAVFFGATPASFEERSGIAIEATAPAGEGIVDVTVQTPAGTSSVNANDTFRYAAGKGKPGGSENEDPEHKTGEPGGPGTEQPGTGNTNTGAGNGSKSGSGGVLGSTSGAAAACQLTLRNKHLAVTGSRTVALRLQRTGAGSCSGKLTLSFNKAKRGKKPKLQTIGTASFAMGVASSKVLKIDLNKLGRKLFRNHGGKLNASLSVVRSVPSPRLARSASVRLTYKKAKKVTLHK
jgi:hypothetical protein